MNTPSYKKKYSFLEVLLLKTPKTLIPIAIPNKAFVSLDTIPHFYFINLDIGAFLYIHLLAGLLLSLMHKGGYDNPWCKPNNSYKSKDI